MKWLQILYSIFLLSFSNTLIVSERIPFFDAKSSSVLCYTKDSNSLQNVAIPCPLPVHELRSGRHILAAIGDHYTQAPDWLNVTLATLGQRLMQKNLVGFLYSTGISSLLVGTSVDALRVVASAGNITRPDTAAKRYLGNLLHFMFWSHGDLLSGKFVGDKYRIDQTSLFESLNLIRSVHEKVAHQTKAHNKLYRVSVVSPENDKVQLNDKLWAALDKDLNTSPLAQFKNNEIFPPRDGGAEYYLNQFAMMLQYWAFVALPTMNTKAALFLPNSTEEEVKGYLHFWAFVAHVMGLKPEYNICLQPDVQTARKYFRKLLEVYFAPGLFKMDYESKVVLEVSVKGISKIYPFVDETLALKQLCEDLLWIDAKNVKKALSPPARIYSSLLENFRFFTQYSISNSAVKFAIRGMIQTAAIDHLGFNILLPRNFTNGIIAYDENVLETTNLWLWLKEWSNGQKNSKLSTWNNLR